MSDEDDHVAAVDAWRSGVTMLPAGAVLTELERAFAALWRRAHTTLGDVTLTAIGDRVLYDATARYPNQRGCRLEIDGLDTTELRRRLADPTFDREELVRFASFVLTELLTVVGALTAEVLTSALHRALRENSGETNGNDDGKDSGG